MLSGISLTCIAGSYIVTFLLELTRLVYRAPIRNTISVICMSLGLVAHSFYLYNLAVDEANQGSGVLSSWYDWCLVATWVLAAAYLGLAIRRPQNAVGVFLLPLVIGLIGAALVFRSVAPEPFPQDDARRYWRIVHGIALLMGTVSVLMGFATGLMYLVQAYRLKHKLLPRQGFRLPSLEWLRRCSQETLFVSTLLLAVGVLSGVVLNLYQSGGVHWTDPVVSSSLVLFVWLVAASLFEWLYKPAREGHKVAYLTMASLVFLGLALAFVLYNRHAVSLAPPGAGKRAVAGPAERPSRPSSIAIRPRPSSIGSGLPRRPRRARSAGPHVLHQSPFGLAIHQSAAAFRAAAAEDRP